MSREKISEAEIERLKEGDILESTFSQFAQESQALFHPLIAERDRYMAARLRQEAEHGAYRHILAVVGAGHLKGIRENLEAACTDTPQAVISHLDRSRHRRAGPR
jgi:pheromone shutdown protein TraB